MDLLSKGRYSEMFLHRSSHFRVRPTVRSHSLNLSRFPSLPLWFELV